MEPDQTEALRLLTVIVISVLVGLGMLIFLLPEALPIFSDLTSNLDSGLTLKEAAILSLCATALLFIVFAIFAGDGIAGELGIMITGFGVFCFFLTLTLAWIF